MLFAKVTAAASLLLLLTGIATAVAAVLFLVAAVTAAVVLEERDEVSLGGLAPSVAIELDLEPDVPAAEPAPVAPALEPVAA